MPKQVPTARRRFTAPSGREWEAELCMHAGTDAQAPRLVVIFRDPTRAHTDRYNLLPPGSPKVPKEAAKAIDDDTLRRLLQRSVSMKRFSK